MSRFSSLSASTEVELLSHVLLVAVIASNPPSLSGLLARRRSVALMGQVGRTAMEGATWAEVHPSGAGVTAY